MNQQERADFIKEFDAQYCNAVMEDKGRTYSEGSGGGAEDVHANFSLVASLLNGAPMDDLTVAAVYFLKHVASICRFVVTREEDSEGINGRLGDGRNYLAIMAALIREADTLRQEELKLGMAEALLPRDPKVALTPAEVACLKLVA